MFRRRFAGEDHLVVVQPDGTHALIPSWMTEEIAGSATLTTCPQLSLDRLVELRARLDALVASSRGESAPREGGDLALGAQPTERSIRGGAGVDGVSGPLRHELIHLIERLLAEAVSRVEVQSEGHETKEPAHEQDHA